MSDNLLSTFEDPGCHAAIARIIRRRSTNPTDIREVALEGLDLRGVRDVIDLGCGFGFVSKAVAERCSEDAIVLGVDACPENRAVFLVAIAETNRRADYRNLRIGPDLRWPSRSFDLVVASYSLYFFPDVLSEAARLLRPDGMLLAITHHRSNLETLFRAAGLEREGSSHDWLVQRFCAEDACEMLEPHFGEVERIEYPNSLRFEREHLQELLLFAALKLSLLLPPGEDASGMDGKVRGQITATLQEEGELLVEKDDAIFRCRRPRCR